MLAQHHNAQSGLKTMNGIDVTYSNEVRQTLKGEKGDLMSSVAHKLVIGSGIDKCNRA